MTFVWAATPRTILQENVADILGGGSIRIYTGSKPASPADAATGTLLAEITLNNPADSSAGVLDTDPALAATAVASGAAGWFRVRDSRGNTVGDGTVTATDGGGDLVLDTVDVAVGALVTITAGTITVPAS